VFTRENGEPVHPDEFYKMFRRHIRWAEVPRIRLHDLRHTYATFALGVHPKVVSEQLGHSSISLTLDTYSHAIPALQEEAVETVAGLIFGSAT
jgi:integrase